ncbi:hypothetical protein LEP1GSC047_3758 [Leptospira inadai serovar Lyme str. 10]|uniref:Yip1 domain protein n=2 Tax=Leptospira inadai serovar Lyme TaxID=293084 RepID=V6HCD4_9LEPT|nr:hypothetical protein [Leptospira inadai]EQA37282.1 hypothetical protein LEP1GSC047_3758 [Leptospira inadai serovar Lyme str. 10]PNV76523.1 hypothetical protein BES34_002735 [Leptospira inadai serovar Lyme]
MLNKLESVFEDFYPLFQKKIELEDRTESALRRAFFRYMSLSLISVILIGLTQIIGIYLRNSQGNNYINNLYINGKIGSLMYYAAHFPQNLISIFLLWLFLPILFALIWYLALLSLNGAKSSPNRLTLSLLTFNGFYLTMAGISLSGFLEILKSFLPFGGFLMSLLTIFQALVICVGYISSFVYFILGFQKQYDQPIGRAVAQTLSPLLLLFFLLYFFL